MRTFCGLASLAALSSVSEVQGRATVTYPQILSTNALTTDASGNSASVIQVNLASTIDEDGWSTYQ